MAGLKSFFEGKIQDQSNSLPQKPFVSQRKGNNASDRRTNGPRPPMPPPLPPRRKAIQGTDHPTAPTPRPAMPLPTPRPAMPLPPTGRPAIPVPTPRPAMPLPESAQSVDNNAIQQNVLGAHSKETASAASVSQEANGRDALLEQIKKGKMLHHVEPDNNPKAKTQGSAYDKALERMKDAVPVLQEEKVDSNDPNNFSRDENEWD